MGNRYYANSVERFISLAALAAFIISLVPLSAHAAPRDPHDMLVTRLCAVQERLGSRLPRAIINPSVCNPVEEPVVTLTAEPSTITEGANSTLSWSSTNATSCTASNGWSGAKNLSGNEVVSPEETTTYTLTCTGDGGSDTESLTVTVVPVAEPTVNITATPLSIDAGVSSELSWQSSNADTCTASNGWTGSKALDGSENVSPTVTTTYAISCTGSGGTAQDSVTVTVVQPAEATLTLQKTVVNDNGGTAVANDFQAKIDDVNVPWGIAQTVSVGVHTASETNLTGYTAGNWGGDCAADGSITLAAGEQKICTITNDDIAPEAPTLEFSATPLTVNEDGVGNATTTLSWDSEYTTSCTASGAAEWNGPKSVDGSEIVTPTADTIYELDCTGPGGDIHAEVTVDFVPLPTMIGKMVISEVYYDVASSTSGSESSNEWVELYNGTNASVNLSGWFVGDASSTDSINESVVLLPGEFAVVVASTTPAGIPEGVAVIILSSSIGFNGFTNAGDGARLLDPSSVLIDAVGYGTNVTVSPTVTIPEETDGHAIKRVQLESDTDTAADWIDTDTPTPGTN